MVKQIQNETNSKVNEYIAISSLKYMYELGPYLAEKYALEKEIVQTNRIIELIFSSMITEDDMELNEYYILTNKEFKNYDKLGSDLSNKINKIRNDIDGQMNLDIRKTMEDINKSLLVLDPSFKTSSKKWDSISWPNIDLSDIKEKISINNEIEASLKEFLPEEVVESVQSEKELINKKKDLKESLNFLKGIKTDLDDVLLNLLPEGNILN